MRGANEQIPKATFLFTWCNFMGRRIFILGFMLKCQAGIYTCRSMSARPADK